eukprot:TRINITY_DN10540_c0_g2_i2.p1 TRINITY_DN10540_c0_g2~~TRINITY_DN10540_c0_g2_i2.p1  ORF type:complete len:398 (-),score=67.14 TRINITY_DN10540_c0_g2_i2:9-1202(-)
MEPIPTCDMICRKRMECGLHYCKRKCHEDECGDCLEKVEQKCVCGLQTQLVECFRVYKEKEQFTCEKVCKTTKSCGSHKCNNVCCPAKNTKNNYLHLCTKVCGKALKCGKHTCDAFCHLGLCSACPVFINQPLACACGLQIKMPPLPCGTVPPACDMPCQRQRACGHPCPLRCHLDACPPCNFEVSKPCVCGTQIIDRVQCSKEVVCTKVCGKPLPCGHSCIRVCHTGDCYDEEKLLTSGCGQRCGRQRKTCGHLCIAPCHLDKECPTSACNVLVKIKCECGNREAYVECGSTEIEVKKTIKCNEKCLNVKRFGTFYEEDNSRKPYYSLALVRYAKLFPNILKIEKKIDKMLREGEASVTVDLDNNQERKKMVEMWVSQHYKPVSYTHLTLPTIYSV